MEKYKNYDAKMIRYAQDLSGFCKNQPYITVLLSENTEYYNAKGILIPDINDTVILPNSDIAVLLNVHDHYGIQIKIFNRKVSNAFKQELVNHINYKPNGLGYLTAFSDFAKLQSSFSD